MKRLDTNIGTLKRPLQQRPEVFNAVRVNLSANVFLRMVHHFMHEVVEQFVVADCAIGVDRRAVLYVLEKHVLQRFALYIWHDTGADLAKLAVVDALHDCLVRLHSNRLELLPPITVHVGNFATNERLVSLDLASLTANGTAPKLLLRQGLTNPLQHEPCRLLGNAKRPRQFMRRDSIAAIRQHPDRSHPLVKAKRGIFHDRFDFDGELLLAVVAEPNPASLNERELLSTAPRARNFAIRPPQFAGIAETILRIGKIGYGFLQSLWFLNVGVHGKKYILNPHVCQVYSYRFFAESAMKEPDFRTQIGRRFPALVRVRSAIGSFL